MRIASKLRFAALVPAFLAIVVAVGLAYTLVPVRELQRQQENLADITADISELRDLARAYVDRHEERPRRQFIAQYRELNDDLSVGIGIRPEYRRRLRSLRDDARLAYETFLMVDRNHTLQPDIDADVYLEAHARLTGQLFTRLRGLTGDTAALGQQISDDIVEMEQRVYYVIALLTFISAIVLTWMLLRLRTGITTSLEALRKGTLAIAGGDLSYRIGLKGRDELTDLGRSFDHMNDRLRAITVSRDDLETEVQRRTQAEVGLTKELQTTRVLLDAAASLAAWTDLDGILGDLSHTVQRVTGRNRVCISTWDAEEETLVAIACSQSQAPPRVGSLLTSLSAELRQVVSEGIVRVSRSPEPALQIDASGEHDSIRLLHVPMLYRGSVVGVITIGGAEEVKDFSTREISLAEGIASQAAVAVENGRLYANEHRVAETLQEALLALPDSLPGIEFDHMYRSASEAARVGGDFYDIFEMDRSLIGVTIGDVAGKGLEAAVLTSLVKNAIRVHAHDPGMNPEVILRRTNDVVYRSTPVGSFVTVFFGVLNLTSGRMEYASAGHTTGAVIGQTGVTTLLPSTGTILGAFDDIEIVTGQARLDAGEVLFLYTDGLTEARRSGELFGDQRVFDLLSTLRGESPNRVLDGVLDCVSRYADGKLSDDLAMLALSIEQQ